MQTMPDELRRAYDASAYVVTDAPEPMVLQVGVPNQAAARLLQAHKLQSAVFITAHNPWGQALSPTENHTRHQKMLAYLRPHGPLYNGFGVSPQGNWPAETSVLVMCDSDALRAHWMDVYEQNAVVLVGLGGTVLLGNLGGVSC